MHCSAFVVIFTVIQILVPVDASVFPFPFEVCFSPTLAWNIFRFPRGDFPASPLCVDTCRRPRAITVFVVGLAFVKLCGRAARLPRLHEADVGARDDCRVPFGKLADAGQNEDCKAP